MVYEPYIWNKNMKNFGTYMWNGLNGDVLGCVGSEKMLWEVLICKLGSKKVREYKPYIEMMLHKVNDVA